MIISNINYLNRYDNTYFCAKKVSSHKIKEIDSNGNLNEKKVVFVEFDKNNPHDAKLFEDIANNPKQIELKPDFTDDIATDFCRLKSVKHSSTHFFAMVKPQLRYKRIKRENILGLVQLFDSNANDAQWVDFIQSATECRFDNKNRKYIDVGKRMLDGIVGNTKKDITLSPDSNAIPFYLNYGFEFESEKDRIGAMRYKNKKN